MSSWSEDKRVSGDLLSSFHQIWDERAQPETQLVGQFTSGGDGEGLLERLVSELSPLPVAWPCSLLESRLVSLWPSMAVEVGG